MLVESEDLRSSWLRICVMLAHLEGEVGLLDGEGQREGMVVVGMVLDRVVVAR